MEDLRILELLPDYSSNPQRLGITGASHNNRKCQERCAEKREKLILINCIFVERVIGKLAFGDFDSSQVLDMVFDDSDNSLVSCSSIPE